MNKAGNFHNLAETYHKARRDYDSEAINHVTSFFDQQKFPLILDLGCGTGKSTRPLASPSRFVIGCDRELTMITKAIEFPTVNTSYCVGESSDLPFADNTFDFITAFGSFHWIIYSNKEQSINEIKRILKPQGVFIVVYKAGETPVITAARKILSKHSTKPLPEARKNYHPDKVLLETGFAKVKKKEFNALETYTIEEALLHMQSMSSWNQVKSPRRKQALKDFENLLKEEWPKGFIEQDLKTTVVSGINVK